MMVSLKLTNSLGMNIKYLSMVDGRGIAFDRTAAQLMAHGGMNGQLKLHSFISKNHHKDVVNNLVLMV